MLDSFAEISAGCSPEFLAAFLHVSIRTITNWRRGRPEAPYAARALLFLRLGGDMATVWGNGWEGFKMRPDAFFHPFWRRGYTPGELKAFFYQVQVFQRMERDVEDLRAELARQVMSNAAAQAVKDPFPGPRGALR